MAKIASDSNASQKINQILCLFLKKAILVSFRILTTCSQNLIGFIVKKEVPSLKRDLKKFVHYRTFNKHLSNN